MQGVSFRHGPVNLFVFPDLIYGADCRLAYTTLHPDGTAGMHIHQASDARCGWDQMFRP